jgi:hypothetical protein
MNSRNPVLLKIAKNPKIGLKRKDETVYYGVHIFRKASYDGLTNINSQTPMEQSGLESSLVLTTLILLLLPLVITNGSSISLSTAVFASNTQVHVPNANTSTQIMQGVDHTISHPATINITIGDLILEGQGGPSGLIGLRILDLDGEKGPKIEVSYLANVTIRGDINATDMGTMRSVTNPDRTVYSEGQGILTSATGNMATYTFQGVGKYSSNGTLRNHGSYFFISDTSPSSELSFLNNKVGVYADEIDIAGKGIARIWELK